MSVSDSAPLGPARPALRFGTPVSRVPDTIGYPPEAPPSGSEVPNDVALESADTEWYSIRGVSIRGEGKRLAGGHRQDDLRVARLGYGKSSPVIIAIADGVGNADLSATGARLACQFAIGYVRESATTGPYDPAALASAVQAGLFSWAGDKGLDPSRLATTLVVALIEPDEGGGAVARVTAVGDSGASVVESHEIRPVFAASDGGAVDGDMFANAPTRALPVDGVPSAHTVVELAPGSALLLWTDGFEPLLKFSESRNYFRDVFAAFPPPAGADFLWMVDARLKSYDDDRTVVAAWIR